MDYTSVPKLLDSKELECSTLGKPEHFKLDFPNAEPIPFEYYTDTSYNELRRCKLILFTDCLSSSVVSFENDYKNINIKKKVIFNLLVSLGFKKTISKKIIDYTYGEIYSKFYIAEKIERGCFNRTINKSRHYNIRAIWETLKFRDLYHDICYKVAININPTSIIDSIYLINLIKNKSVKLSNIANLSGKKLCPEKYEKIDKKINLRVNQEVKIKYSTLYRCFRCKNNKCTSERVYNRSLDEGVNLRITCTVCYNEWGA
jgi:DNA-directed RNA polymerase subunit M/transcription elongation factor TFIIS